MSLSAQLKAGGAVVTLDPSPPAPAKAKPLGFDPGEYRGNPVKWSPDLQRVLALPRRTFNPHDPQAAKLWTAHLRRDRKGVPCTCDAQWGVKDKFGKIIPGSGCILELNEIQGWAFEEGHDAKGCFVNVGTGHGKALALDTRIPTPGGWALMGDLRVGDRVIGSNGSPCRVTAVTDVQYDRDCFDVVFSDGSHIVADKDHRWLTQDRNERRQADRGAVTGLGPTVRTTGQIADSIRHHAGSLNHSIDTAGALDLPECQLPFDPYLLGAWLGDGTTAIGAITSADPEILAHFDAAGFKRGACTVSGKTLHQTFLGLYIPLRAAGVLGNKHVPASYFRASKAQRLALLQGLMDTDGCACKDNTVEFCSTLPELASAVFELASSLGQQPKLYTGRATLYGKDCGEKYRVCWQPTICVFRLRRKLDRLRLGRYRQSQVKYRRYIESVTPVTSVPVRCIEVDSPDHTYLCGDAMIPTHNSAIGLLMGMAIFNLDLGRGYGAEPRRVVLLIPSKARRAMVSKHYPQLSAHFETPNLANWKETADRPFINDGRPVLHIVTYSELQVAKNSNMLSRIKPHLVVADEAHSLANLGSSRGKRYERVFREGEDEASPDSGVFCVPMSGTMGDKSIRQFGHHLRFSLREKSPVPNSPAVLDEWAGAIDAGKKRSPMGELAKLCAPAENVQEAFARRLNDTLGVITTDTPSVNADLFISAFEISHMPAEVEAVINQTRKTDVRPDEEESTEALTTAAWCRQMAAGFYYKWIYPRKEDPALIKKWFEIRKLYNREVRSELQGALEFCDSPKLLHNAAKRWHEGYTHDGTEYPARTTRGPMPYWASKHWKEWQEIKDKVVPSTKAVWLSDFLVKEAASWATSHLGIVWTEHKAFGRAVATMTGLPFYEGGKMDPELDEDGSRSVICSVSANCDSKNLQKWSANLFCNPMSSGKIWEQAMARTHRQGQLAEAVTVEVFLHTPEMRRAFDTARDRAYFAHTVLKTPQKLVYGTVDMTHAVEDRIRKTERPVFDDWWENID